MSVIYQDPFGAPWRLNWLRMLLTWEGGIWQFFWVEWLFAVAVCAAIVTISYYTTRNENDSELDEQIEFLIETVKFINTRFQSALSLMLGFYTSTIFGRWWSVRQAEGGAMGNITNCAMAIATMIHEDMSSSSSSSCGAGEKQPLKEESYEEGKEEKQTDVSIASALNDEKVIDIRNVRMQLIRWVNLSHALVIGDIYQKKPNEFSSLEHLKEIGLATEKEYNFLSKQTRGRWAAPLVWFSDLMMELKAKELFGVGDGTVRIFQGYIAGVRGSLGSLYGFRNTPIPLSYRQLVNITVRSYMAILLLHSAIVDIERDNNLGGLTKGAFWIILSFAFEYFIFVGWLSLADALGNPFRHWADEFEWENYVNSLLMDTVVISTGLLRDGSSCLSEATDESGEQLKKQLMERCSSVQAALNADSKNLRVKYTGF